MTLAPLSHQAAMSNGMLANFRDWTRLPVISGVSEVDASDGDTSSSRDEFDGIVDGVALPRLQPRIYALKSYTIADPLHTPRLDSDADESPFVEVNRTSSD